MFLLLLVSPKGHPIYIYTCIYIYIYTYIYITYIYAHQGFIRNPVCTLIKNNKFKQQNCFTQMPTLGSWPCELRVWGPAFRTASLYVGP